jgi:hypothetical protein
MVVNHWVAYTAMALGIVQKNSINIDKDWLGRYVTHRDTLILMEWLPKKLRKFRMAR